MFIWLNLIKYPLYYKCLYIYVKLEAEMIFNLTKVLFWIKANIKIDVDDFLI